MGAALLSAGCVSLQGYEGAKRPSDEVARISGDLRVTAGSPISVLLRQVDGHTLNLSENGVDVLPGKHTLLVDCIIRETSRTSRYSIEAEVFSGRHYRLRAETGPGMRECTAVNVEDSD
jgi:hypothetical protein